MTTQLSLGFETGGQSDSWQPAPGSLSLPFDVDAHREPLLAQLVDIISRDRASPQGVTATPTKLIDLTHYASRLGVSRYSVKRALGDRFQVLQDAVSAELVPPLAKSLAREIAADIGRTGRPVIGRGGNLDRKHYATILSVHPAYLGRQCRSILAEADEKYGTGSKVEARLSEMQEWLSDRFDRRQLPCRDGKIDRSAFQIAFGLNGGTFMVRYPGIRSLFEEFDARAVAEGYRPAAEDSDLQLLIAALENSPKLNSNRLTINRPALARITGIPTNRFWQEPLVSAIRLEEEKILSRAERSEIDPYFAGRIFPFSDLAHVWSSAFLTAVGSQFKLGFGYVQNRENCKGAYLAIYNLLSWVGESAFEPCIAVRNIAADGRLDSDQWELAVLAYRDHIVGEIASGARSKAGADGCLQQTRRGLARMDPVLPAMQSDLVGVKNAKAFTSHRPSLAEASAAPLEGAPDHYLEFARTMLVQAADRFKVDLNTDESVQFMEALSAELSASPNLPADPAHAILLVLNKRLAALREGAMRIVHQAKRSLANGNELLRQADIDGSQFFRSYRDAPTHSPELRSLLRDWFPDPTSGAEARDRSLGNLLSLAIAEFDGMLPGAANEKARLNLGQFFQKRYQELGTLQSLSVLLNPNRDACGAVLTLYLIDGGANVSVGRTLDVDCIESSNEPGFKLITGHKARAKGKPIYAELPAGSDSVDAIEWYAEASWRYRGKATKSDARQLFVAAQGEKFELISPHWYTNWFKVFGRSLPELLGAEITPSMIRPSVLLKAALENDGRLQVGRAIGQHGQAVTRGYQEKLPIRLLRDQHMRRFQRHYETRVLQNVVDVARDLGIPADEFENRITELEATGLGTLCRDPYKRPGSEGERCRTLDCWRDCPQLLIVPEVESIAMLQIWRASLEAVRGEWERDHPERWGAVWLPWLCLTEVVEERMSRGKLLLTWRQAQARATELRAQPNFIAPRPF